MSTLISTLMCHAPVVVPAVVGARGAACAQSTAAMREAARRIVARGPEVVVVVSPHTPRVAGGFTVIGGARVKGDFAEFGAPEVAVDLPAAATARELIRDEAAERGVRVDEIGVPRLDHGALVPLTFLVEAGWRGPTVVLGLPRAADAHAMIAVGGAIARASAAERWALVASGDCSHRLTPGAPAGFHPEAARFDAVLADLVARGDDQHLAALDDGLRRLAAEDVVESVLVAAGATGLKARGREVLSYEGPYGVGYLVAVLDDELAAERTDVLLDIAEDALRARLEGRARAVFPPLFAASAASGVPGEPGEPVSGCFVTWRRGDGELRGCVGKMSLAAPLGETVAELAVTAAQADPRFPPVDAAELDELEAEVSLLGPPEPVASAAELDPAVWGVEVQSGWRRGVLLPGIEGVDTVDEQLNIALWKAGIRPGEPYTLQKFKVKKISREKHV